MNYLFIYGMFFETNALASFDYWLRIDADSNVIFRVDPFEHMHATSTHILYQGPYSGGGCTDTLSEEVDTYLAANAIQKSEAIRTALIYQSYYYGNLMAGNLNIFRSTRYKDFAAYLVKKQGIWKYRWDDQHILCYASNIFWPGRSARINALNKHGEYR